MQTDWPTAIAKLTDGIGADFVVDTVGGLKESIVAIALHQTRPAVDRVFAFEDLGAALRYLGEGRHFGKVCLRA